MYGGHVSCSVIRADMRLWWLLPRRCLLKGWNMLSVSMQDVYRGFFVPALNGIILLSLASIAFLLTSGLPRMERVDPGAVRTVEIILLGIAGVLVPFLLLFSRRARDEPRFMVSTACVAALMVHAAALGEPVRTGGQGITSTLAAVLSAVFGFAALFTVMERLDAQPQRGGFRWP